MAVGSIRAKRIGRVGRALDRHVFELLSREPNETIQAGWKTTLALFDRLEYATREAGSDLAVFMIPIVYQISDERLTLFLDSHEATASDLDLLSPQRRMKAWGQERHVFVIDLQPELRAWAIEHDARPYETGDGHWDEDGHRVAARIVSRELAQRLEPGDEGPDTPDAAR